MSSAPAPANYAREYAAPTRARESRTANVRTGKEVIALATAKTFRPEELAATLGISGKIVRAYLRKTYARPASAKGSTWVLSAKQASDTLAYFKKRNPEAYAKAQKKRAPKRTPKAAPAPTESA